MTTSTHLEPATNDALQQCSEPEQTRTVKFLVPKADVYETANEIVVTADLPGVDESSVDITVEKNVLSITGSVCCVNPPGYGLSHAEFAVGDYQRKFVLPNEIDRDGITASMKNGVLKLTLPKSLSAQVKKINVIGG